MGEEKTEVPVVDTCPRCGWKADGTSSGASEEEVKEYLRCVIGGSQFTKMYELYGGEIKLEFKSLTNEEVDRFNTLAYRMLPSGDEMSVMDSLLKLKMLYFLKSVNAGGTKAEFDSPVTLKEVADIGGEFNRRFGEYPELVTRAISQTLFLFEELQRMLSEAAFDPNFWEGVGLR